MPDGRLSRPVSAPPCVVSHGGVWESGRSGQDRVECLLGSSGIVSLGGRYAFELAHHAHHGDGDIAQGREVAWQMAHRDPAAVLVVAEITHIVYLVFNMPVLTDQIQQFLGPCLAPPREVRP